MNRAVKILSRLLTSLSLMSVTLLIPAQAEEGGIVLIDLEGRQVQALESQLDADSGYVAQSWVEFLVRNESLASTPEKAKAMNDLSMQSARVGALEKPVEELRLELTATSDGRSKVHLLSKDVLTDEFPTELTDQEAARLKSIMQKFETYVETGFYTE